MPHSNVRWPELNPSPTLVSFEIKSQKNTVFNALILQFCQPSQHPIATPHSLHSFPQAPHAPHCFNHGSSIDDNIIGFHFHDRERELYERQIDFERELDRERLKKKTI